MTVDISDKIAIIRKYKITPDELTLLLSLNPTPNTLSELARGNHSTLIEWINNSINNPSIKDERRLYFAHFANIIEKYIEENVIDSILDSQKDSISDMVENYAQDMMTFDHCEPHTEDEEKEYKEFKKHKKDIQSWSQEEITTKLINFVETEFPYIFETGIKGKKQDVRTAFYASINLYSFFWDLNDRTRNYLCNAQEFLAVESEKRRVEYERKMVTEWANEFKNWCDNLGLTRYTKSNIKEFFKELGLKVLPTTIDLLKSNL